MDNKVEPSTRISVYADPAKPTQYSIPAQQMHLFRVVAETQVRISNARAWQAVMEYLHYYSPVADEWEIDWINKLAQDLVMLCDVFMLAQELQIEGLQILCGRKVGVLAKRDSTKMSHLRRHWRKRALRPPLVRVTFS